jgi:hypothetical protein
MDNPEVKTTMLPQYVGIQLPTDMAYRIPEKQDSQLHCCKNLNKFRDSKFKWL